MTSRLSRLVSALGVVAALLALAAPAHAEKRVALVVGNNDYKNVPKLQKGRYAEATRLHRDGG
jgi:ABC-type sugar transport system substrate-binding protein